MRFLIISLLIPLVLCGEVCHWQTVSTAEPYYKVIFHRGDVVTEQKDCQVVDVDVNGDCIVFKFVHDKCHGKPFEHMEICKGDKEWQDLMFVIEKKDGHKCDDCADNLKPLIKSCSGEMILREMTEEEHAKASASQKSLVNVANEEDHVKFKCSHDSGVQICECDINYVKHMHVDNHPEHNSMNVVAYNDLSKPCYVAVEDENLYKNKKLVIESNPHSDEDCHITEENGELICYCHGPVKVRHMTPEEKDDFKLEKGAPVWLNPFYKVIYDKGEIVTEQKDCKLVDVEEVHEETCPDCMLFKFQHDRTEGRPYDYVKVNRGDKDWKDVRFVLQSKDHKCEGSCEGKCKPNCEETPEDIKPLVSGSEGGVVVRDLNEQEKGQAADCKEVLDNMGEEKLKFRVCQYEDKQITQSCKGCVKHMHVHNHPCNNSMKISAYDEDNHGSDVLVQDADMFKKRNIIIESAPHSPENVASDCRNSELKDIICDCDGSVQVREMTPEEEAKAKNVCVDSDCLVIEPPPTPWYKCIYHKGNIITEHVHIGVIQLLLDDDVLTCKFEWDDHDGHHVDHMSITKGDKDWGDLEWTVEKKPGCACSDTTDDLKPLIASCEGEMELRHITEDEKARSMVTTIVLATIVNADSHLKFKVIECKGEQTSECDIEYLKELKIENDFEKHTMVCTVYHEDVPEKKAEMSLAGPDLFESEQLVVESNPDSSQDCHVSDLQRLLIACSGHVKLREMTKDEKAHFRLV